MQITVVGSINMDLVSQVARFPLPGETILGRELKSYPGGKGANQAVAAARLGAEVTMIGRVGDDSFGSQLKSNLTTEGIDTRHVLLTKHTASGVAEILVDDAGQNTIVVIPGANDQLTPLDIDQAELAISAAEVLLLQLEIPLDSVHRAAKIAHDHGVKVLLNPAPAQALPTDLLAWVDILIPNENEAHELLPMANNMTDVAQPSSLAGRLRALGPEVVIITTGDQGVIVAAGSSLKRYPAFFAPNVVDTTAAGDAFVGGLATAIASGNELSEAVLWANAAGMLAVTRAGAQPSLPSRLELEALIAVATAEQRHGITL